MSSSVEMNFFIKQFFCMQKSSFSTLIKYTLILLEYSHCGYELQAAPVSFTPLQNSRHKSSD